MTPENRKVSLRAVRGFRETKVKLYYCLHSETGGKTEIGKSESNWHFNILFNFLEFI